MNRKWCKDPGQTLSLPRVGSVLREETLRRKEMGEWRRKDTAQLRAAEGGLSGPRPPQAGLTGEPSKACPACSVFSRPLLPRVAPPA